MVEIKGEKQADCLYFDNSNDKVYKMVNGTFYHDETSYEVIRILENARDPKRIYHLKHVPYRLKISFGDTKTGKAWGDVETGYIGRSTGTIKIPLIINNQKSTGGPALLDHCIVKIEYANKKDGGVLYQHPNYQE